MLTDQDKAAIRKEIISNQHEVFIISMEEMDAIVQSSPKGKAAHVQQAWLKIKEKAEIGANYTASAGDIKTLSKLVADLGGFATGAYVKTYNGKPHIILKGHPGLRKVLTGTKYGIKNPKVVTMGLGKIGAIHAAKSGGILTIVLLTTYRVADYFLTDQATLSQLIGALAMDVVKVGIATGAAVGAASLLVGFGVTIAIGPIAVVIVVGTVVSMALNAIDQYYGITDRVILCMDELSEEVNSYLDNTEKELKGVANEAIDSVIDYAIDSAKQLIIDTVKYQLSRFLMSRPTVR